MMKSIIHTKFLFSSVIDYIPQHYYILKDSLINESWEGVEAAETAAAAPEAATVQVAWL